MKAIIAVFMVGVFDVGCTQQTRVIEPPAPTVRVYDFGPVCLYAVEGAGVSTITKASINVPSDQPCHTGRGVQFGSDAETFVSSLALEDGECVARFMRPMAGGVLLSVSEKTRRWTPRKYLGGLYCYHDDAR